MTVRRTLLTIVGAGLALVAGAGPAAADPAEPGDYSSQVTAVVPAVDGVTVRVAGGDGFLDVQVAPGHEATVGGYTIDGEQDVYLQFLADGTVQRNRRSPATYINESRFGDIDPPTGLSADDEPEWETVATDGEYAWHDHRIHFMGLTPQANFVRGAVVPSFDPWHVPMTVDGVDVDVQGELFYAKSTPTLLWVGLAVVVAAGLAVAARFRTIRVAAVGLLVAAVAAVGISVVQYGSIPPNAGRSVLTIIVPALGALAAAIALLRSDKPIGAIGGLASVALLAGWALLRIQVLLKPVLPTDLPFVVDRLGTVLAVGTAVAGAVVVVNSGALRLPELSDDE